MRAPLARKGHRRYAFLARDDPLPVVVHATVVLSRWPSERCGTKVARAGIMTFAVTVLSIGQSVCRRLHLRRFRNPSSTSLRGAPARHWRLQGSDAKRMRPVGVATMLTADGARESPSPSPWPAEPARPAQGRQRPTRPLGGRPPGAVIASLAEESRLGI